MDKDIKISAKNKEHLLMFSVSPFVLKLSAENALEYIGYLEYLITNGLL